MYAQIIVNCLGFLYIVYPQDNLTVDVEIGDQPRVGVGLQTQEMYSTIKLSVWLIKAGLVCG